MLGSRVLETAIGLATVFLFLSLTASSVTESIARAIGLRAKKLGPVLNKLFVEVAPTASPPSTIPLSQAATDAAPKTRRLKLPLTSIERQGGKPIVSYVSPEAFVQRLERAGSTHDPFEIRAIFDDAMLQLQTSYKRWATTVLFLVGLAIAVVANISTIDVAKQLWNDETARQLVVAKVDRLGDSDLQTYATDQQKACGDQGSVSVVGETLPMGWRCAPFKQLGNQAPYTSLGTVAGWLITALMAMLGAQFWFDFLGRFVNLRPGRKPSDAGKGSVA